MARHDLTQGVVPVLSTHLKRLIPVILALGLSGVGIVPAQGADEESASSRQIAVRSAPTPDSAYAVLRTITLPNDRLPDPSYGLAVGVGPDAGDAIYIAAGNDYEGTLLRMNPVSLMIDDTTAVGKYPLGIAVSRDDTVYVVNTLGDSLSVVRGSTMAVDRTIALLDSPAAVALSKRAVDDTVFISSSGTSRSITMLNTDNLDDSVSTSLGSHGASPWGLAVSSDDSAYIASYGANTIFRFNSATPAVSSVVTGADGPIGVAVSADDTVYFTRQVGEAVSRFPAVNPSDLVNRSVSSPQGVAVGPDNRVYVAGQFGGGIITVLNPVTLAVDDSIVIGDRWNSIAVTRSGLVVAADRFAASAVIVSEVSPTLGASAGVAGSTGVVTVGGLPTGVLIDDSTVTSVTFNGAPAAGWSRVAGTNTISGPIPSGTGTVAVSLTLRGGNVASLGSFTYITTPGSPTITGVTTTQSTASVSFSADDTGGSALTRVELALDDTVIVDDSTTNTSSPYVLSGLSASTTYVAYMRVVNAAGTGPWSLASSPFTTLAPPPPPPPIPASAPGNVVATAGDQRANVSWSPPSSTGTYPVSTYQASASPGGQTCLTGTTSCTISGLTNGTAYTFTVMALTGAGWSVPSPPSNEVTPSAPVRVSITITGARSGGLISVSGATVGLDLGGIVTPWTSKNGAAYISGREVLVSIAGTFDWSRKANTRGAWRVYFAGPDGVRSNTVAFGRR